MYFPVRPGILFIYWIIWIQSLIPRRWFSEAAAAAAAANSTYYLIHVLSRHLMVGIGNGWLSGRNALWYPLVPPLKTLYCQ
jgi:hypothetical protein